MPPGPAHRSSHGPTGPSARASAAATSCEPSSCTPARPSRTAARSAGLPDQRAAYGEYRPGSAPAAVSSPTSASPGRTARVTGASSLSARSAASSSASGSTSANASTIQRGWAVATASRSRSSSPAVSRSTQLGEVAVGHPPQHRVHQAGDPPSDGGRGQVHGGGDGGVHRHPHGQQLMCAQPEQVQHRRLQRGGRAAGRRGQDRGRRCPEPGRCRPPARWRTPRPEPVSRRSASSSASTRLAYAPSPLTRRKASNASRRARSARTGHLSVLTHQVPSVGWPSKLTPRAQSAAAIGFLPCACT